METNLGGDYTVLAVKN